MRVSGASPYAAMGMSSAQVLATSASNDTSLLTLGSSTTSAAGTVSDSSLGSSLFGAASATNVFGANGNPFAGAGSVFGADNLTTKQSAVLVNAERTKRTTPQVKLTNLTSVTLESIKKDSEDYMAAEDMAKNGFGLGSLLDKLA